MAATGRNANITEAEEEEIMREVVIDNVSYIVDLFLASKLLQCRILW